MRTFRRRLGTTMMVVGCVLRTTTLAMWPSGMRMFHAVELCVVVLAIGSMPSPFIF